MSDNELLVVFGFGKAKSFFVSHLLHNQLAFVHFSSLLSFSYRMCLLKNLLDGNVLIQMDDVPWTMVVQCANLIFILYVFEETIDFFLYMKTIKCLEWPLKKWIFYFRFTH